MFGILSRQRWEIFVHIFSRLGFFFSKEFSTFSFDVADQVCALWEPELSSWESISNRAWSSHFISSLKLKMYSPFLLREPPPGVGFGPSLGPRGSRSRPGAGVVPAVVIWNQFDPRTVKMPRLPPVLDSTTGRPRGRAAVCY